MSHALVPSHDRPVRSRPRHRARGLAGRRAARGGRPVPRGFTDVFTDFCDVPGLTVDYAGAIDGHYSATARGSGGTVYFVDHQRVTQTYTNQATGLTATDVQRILVKDLKITKVGNVVTILQLATGFGTTYGPDGSAIARNPGQVPLPHRVRRQRDPGGRQRRHRDLLRPGQGLHRAARTTSARPSSRPSADRRRSRHAHRANTRRVGAYSVNTRRVGAIHANTRRVGVAGRPPDRHPGRRELRCGHD